MSATRTRRGGGEGWVLLLVAVLVLALGAGGLIMWSRVVAERAQAAAEQQRRASASAEKSAVEQMRAAERDSGGAEPDEGAAARKGADASAVESATGATGSRAVELARLIGRAVSAADTPGRVEEAKKLVDGAAAELDSGRLKDGPEALSTLRMAIGGAYRSLGDAGKAVPYFKAAADERKARLGERSPDAIRAQMEFEDAERAAGATKR